MACRRSWTRSITTRAWSGPVVALVKSLASALSIGSGGSVGREGPIVQIGSSFGSTLGRLLRVPVWQRITLIAAGAGAGIAATFNTPIGGVLFAVEIMLHEVSARTLVPVTIATVTASYVGRLVLRRPPVLHHPRASESQLPPHQPLRPPVLPAWGCSWAWSRWSTSAPSTPSRTSSTSGSRATTTPATCWGCSWWGSSCIPCFGTTGHYWVEGVGYATVQDVLSGEVSWFLLLLFVLKLLATALTLGSGASGGVFSPAIFLGATLGGVYGLALQRLFPGLPIHPAAFAVAGMAGVVGGSTGAAMAAVVMIFEMTMDYTVIIPMTITVALSYGLRNAAPPQSIYTEKLARRGHRIPDALQANFYLLKKTREVMDTHFVAVPAGDDGGLRPRSRPSEPRSPASWSRGRKGSSAS